MGSKGRTGILSALRKCINLEKYGSSPAGFRVSGLLSNMSDPEDHEVQGEDSISQKERIPSNQKDTVRLKAKYENGFVRYDHLGKEYQWVTPEDLSSKE